MAKKSNSSTPSDRPPIDIAELLSRVDIVALIDRYVPLAKSGAEYEACCPFHSETTPSFKVSPAKQFYHCFGCGANGDAIKFLQEHQGLSFKDACAALGHQDLPEGGSPPEKAPARKPAPRTHWLPVLPAPANAPEPPKAHLTRGRSERSWTYRDGEGRVLGYIHRFTKSNGDKDICPVVWGRHVVTGAAKWRWMGFPEPRPLYGLDRLATRPDAPVLITEGEKCADVGEAELPDYVSVTWPGGCRVWNKVDWTPLAGRNVILWPDCDAKVDKDGALLPEAKQLGMMAMEGIAQILLTLGCTVSIVGIPAPGEKPSGWDIADAVEEGLHGDALAAFVRANLRSPVCAPSPAPSGPSAGRKTAPNATQAGAGKGGPTRDAFDDWQARLYRRKGELVACLANLFDMITHSEEWEGVVAFDEFSQRTVKLRPPPYRGGEPGEWDSADDSNTAMWLTRKHLIAPSSALVAEAIEAVARRNGFHPVRDWLEQLPDWDGIARLEDWLSDYLGVKKTEYSALIGRFYLAGMVKRVMEPGSKFDYCLVLEGTQGKGKSSALAILGGEWFGDTDLDLHNKDSMSALRGKWLYEFAELGSVARAESLKQKSFLSRQVDEYRPVYGRREIRAPRQVVFAGTTNDWEWNKDPTGGRRFWPVDCEGEFNLDGLRAMREQLFAEALAAYRRGDRTFPTADEQQRLFDPEQLAREAGEGLVDALHDWVFAQVGHFSLAQAVMDGLKLDASKLTRDMQTRVGITLRKLGCTRVEKRNGMTRFWFKAPERNASGTKTVKPAQHAEEDGYVPF